MVAAARERGVRLCVNHNCLFKPSVSKARQLVASGGIGGSPSTATTGFPARLPLFRAGRAFPLGWRARRRLRNFLPHLLYLSLLPGTVEAVKA